MGSINIGSLTKYLLSVTITTLMDLARAMTGLLPETKSKLFQTFILLSRSMLVTSYSIRPYQPMYNDGHENYTSRILSSAHFQRFIVIGL